MILLIGPCAQASDLTKLKKILKDNFSYSNDLQEFFTQIIAIDGGVDFALKNKLRPHWAVGDWDSIKNKKQLKKIVHFTLPEKKDFNDLSGALRALLPKGAYAYFAVGFLGMRKDHELSNLFEFSHFLKKKKNAFLCLLNQEGVWILLSQNQKFKWKVKKQTVISLFSPFQITNKIRLKGLYFSLKGKKLPPSSLGLSNLTVSSPIEIQFDQGMIWAYLNV